MFMPLQIISFMIVAHLAAQKEGWALTLVN